MPNKNVNMPSRTLMSRLVSCRVVLWALGTHGPRLLEKVTGPTLRFLPSGVADLFGPLPADLAELLRSARDLMIQAERTHRDQTARTASFRRQRDSSASGVAPLVAGLRDAFRGVYGPEAAEEIGFALRTPQRADELFEQAEHLLQRLGNEEATLPDSRFRTLTFDVIGLATELQPKIAELGEALENVSREARQAEATKIAKDEAVQAYDLSFLLAARTAETMFKLVDLPEIASRVRPSTRRPGVTVEVATQRPTDEPDEPTDSDGDTPDPSPDLPDLPDEDPNEPSDVN